MEGSQNSLCHHHTPNLPYTTHKRCMKNSINTPVIPGNQPKNHDMLIVAYYNLQTLRVTNKGGTVTDTIKMKTYIEDLLLDEKYNLNLTHTLQM